MITRVIQIKQLATRIISTLGDEPVFITEHGESKAVLLSMLSYEAMQRKLELLEGMARGEQAIREGRVVANEPHLRRP
jgi:PHD/YefM family antitoxin component YafN of YafNO toxin-antitoxin module